MEHLARQCHRRWIPKWAHAFTLHGDGLFHERLDYQFLPVDTGRQRLLTQCRQLAIYAHHLSVRGEGRACITKNWITERFSAITRAFHIPATGGWRFAIGRDAGDTVYDLYAHAFVLFMCVWVWRATGLEEAQRLGVSTRLFIRERFPAANGLGYEEQLDENLRPISQIRRQDPHMHLLEAALLAYQSWGLAEDAALAHELVALFDSHFMDAETGCVIEDFDASLTPHPERGHYCEPGHHYEWVWLLWWYEGLFPGGRNLSPLRRTLLDFANQYGLDPEYGGVFNALSLTGEMQEGDKRIWPVTEALKANAIMLCEVEDRDAIKAVLGHLVRILARGYVHKRGFWTETLNRDLSHQTDIMPGTTPYHLYFGVMEALDILKSRGPSKSWGSFWVGVGYHLRRTASDIFRQCRGWVNQYRAGRG